ncbi:MAG: carbohydrate ABC transporter permease [Sphaerochaeta sp.]|nr:carbohydrate ABC transporter permease [Sphaerochaeta sp.]
MKKTRNVFEIVNYSILALLGFVTLFPFLNVVAKSMSGAAAVSSGKVFIFPINFQLETYQHILFKSTFLQSFKVSVIVTVCGTLLAMTCTILTAYPLSRPHFRGRKFFTVLYIFSMVFYGGMVPSYLLMKSLGLIDTLSSLIVALLVSPFNMFVLKSYFEQLPDSIEESARIDGAGDFTILSKIILPMSKPVLATVTMFYSVAYWNDYFHPMLFIDSPSKKTLQLFLYETVKSPETIIEQFSSSNLVNISIDGITSTAVVCATLPIILIYPLVQRFLMSGMTIGAVKE